MAPGTGCFCGARDCSCGNCVGDQTTPRPRELTTPVARVAAKNDSVSGRGRQLVPEPAPITLEILSTESGLEWRLSQDTIEPAIGAASGSPYELRDYLLAAGADPDLVVISGSGGIGIDVRARSSRAAPGHTWLLAESWAWLADSVNAHYWTPREPAHSDRIARAFVGRDAFVQVALHQDSDDRDIIACPGPVYIWAPASMIPVTRAGLLTLAHACCTRGISGVISTKLPEAAAPVRRRWWSLGHGSR